MSRAAQEMQRLADEIKKARRQPTKKGRRTVDEDQLEDVTQGEAHDEHRATGDAAPPAADASPAAAAEEQTMAAETPSAIRSRKWRENQKKKNGRKAKAAKPVKAKRAAATGEAKAMVKTKGDQKWSFVSTSTVLACEAFTALLDITERARTQAEGTDAEAALTEKANRLQRIVSRLGA